MMIPMPFALRSRLPPQFRGGGVFFPQPQKSYRITDTIYVNRPSLCLYGEFKPGQNEGDYYGYCGTVIFCDLSNKPAFLFRQPHGLQHNGPRIESLGFIASDGITSIIEIVDHNNWVIRECVFRGGRKGLSIKSQEDNAWNLVDNCSFLNQTVCGIYDEGLGTEVRGGKFLIQGTGIYLGPSSATSRISNVMFDDGIGIECYGGLHHIENCKFEKCYPGILINGDRKLYRLSGAGNRIFGGSFISRITSGLGIEVLNGARHTRIIGPYFAGGWSNTIKDSGVDTQIIGGVDW